MNIHLTSEDLRRMPSHLSASLVNWLQYERLKPATPTSDLQHETNAEQLSLTLVSTNSNRQASRIASQPATSTQSSDVSTKKKGQHHIRLTQLFAAGITKSGMPVRVRLKQELAEKCGHEYVTKGLSISSRGTVLYQGEEFDKPSPLAERANGSAANGWEYVEVLKNGQWVCLNELRKIWRTAL